MTGAGVLGSTETDGAAAGGDSTLSTAFCNNNAMHTHNTIMGVQGGTKQAAMEALGRGMVTGQPAFHKRYKDARTVLELHITTQHHR